MVTTRPFPGAEQVLDIDEGLVLLPVIGEIGPERAVALSDAFLAHIRSLRARVAIIDLTGMTSCDRAAIEGVSRITALASLFGTTVILTGICPELAKVWVEGGIRIDVQVEGDLRSGIASGYSLLNGRR